ncbi:MAG: hypothetical protein EHM70_03250 [Chloroflexota bacterium]|nr:MAG: hypothetical protein EHM70_03250 [Chloroflexota bacterium]
MDAFDYVETQKAPPKPNISALIWNILTALVLLTTLCIGGVFLLIFFNPAMALNPYPPPTLPSLIVLPTETPTARVLPPTWTPTVTPEPTATRTPLPTVTPFGAATPANAAAEPSSTIIGGMSFVVQAGVIKAIPNINHPDAGCNWMGVAGQANDLSGAPITQGLLVQLGGTLEGRSLEMLSMTATAPQYGPGGFEIQLADKAVLSNSTLWVQLLDQQGLPLSDRVYFDTFADCEKNLIIIQFKQVK